VRPRAGDQRKGARKRLNDSALQNPAKNAEIGTNESKMGRDDRRASLARAFVLIFHKGATGLASVTLFGVSRGFL